MADRRVENPSKTMSDMMHDTGPSAQQVIAVATLLPVGGTLLALSAITLTGTVIGLAIVTPLFLLFSPIIVPAGLVLALAVAGFLASGAFGLTALSSLSWLLNYLRSARQRVPEHVDWAKRRLGDAAERFGERTKDMGQTIQSKAHETARS